MTDTQLDSEAQPAVRQSPSTGSADQPRTPAPPSVLHGVGVGLTLLGVFLLGFVAYLFGPSAISEARVQSTPYPTLRYELSQQGQVVAPLGPTTPGNPVAILTIPPIRITNIPPLS